MTPEVQNIKTLEAKLRLALGSQFINGELFESRELIAKFGNVKLEIYPDEHPPPHFHVKNPDFNVSIDIIHCRIIKGSLDSRIYKKIKYFHKENKDLLIETWNRTRPSDCPVGPILLNT